MHMLFLIRGLPGAGKNFLGNLLSPGNVYSADDFFDGPNGYNFDPSLLPQAHAECQDAVRQNMSEGEGRDEDHFICVANTFTQRWEMVPYLQMAEDHMYVVTVIDLYDAGLTDTSLSIRNVHGVPETSIAVMRTRYEHDWKNGDSRPPWERK